MTKLAKSLNWEVQEREIVLGGILGQELNVDNFSMSSINSFKAIVNDKTGEVLNIPKTGYTPLLNSHLEESAHMIAKASNGTVEGFETFKGGRKVLAFIKAKNFKGSINGNEIHDYIVIGNSHDGSSSIFIGTSTKLIRCANQFSNIQREFTIRHSGQICVKFEDAIKHYKAYYTQKELLYHNFEQMSKVKINKKLIASLTDRLFDVDRKLLVKSDKDISTRKHNMITEFKDKSLERELSALGSNLWGFFNAVTHYTTHVKGQGEFYSNNNSFGNVVGSNANFNEKANKLIMAELK